MGQRSELELAEILVQAGLPDGVVNVLAGADETVGEALITDPRVNPITMTGSMPVGKHIMEVASRYLTPVVLELRGKAPFIVLADAATMRAAVRSWTSLVLYTARDRRTPGSVAGTRVGRARRRKNMSEEERYEAQR